MFRWTSQVLIQIYHQTRVLIGQYRAYENFYRATHLFLHITRKQCVRKVFQTSTKRLMDRGYQHNLKEKMLSEINKTHRNRKSALLKQNSKEKKEMSVSPSPYYNRSRLMEKWNLIQNQPLLCQRFTKPPIISHKKGKSWQRTCLLEPKY